MKALRRIAVFPLEVVLGVCVVVYVVTELVCYVVGRLCQLIEGDGA
jgi:hypothetical protein